MARDNLTDIKKKKLYKNEWGLIGYLKDGMLRGVGVSVSDSGRLCPVTKKECEDFYKRKKEFNARLKKKQEENQRILNLVGAGLLPSDFCRFREASEEKGKVIVCTRESGVNGFSLGAVKKAGDKLVGRTNDRGDQTYVYYEFKVDNTADNKTND